ncbi:MAG: glycosyltransferase family 4 protein [Anaerolineae bacterium]|nr:glycosyltransferase family 4 protein [Anaerolineae bacterium]
MTRPIKVMHIAARLNIGGVAIYVIQLTAYLTTPAFQSQLVCGVVGASEGDMRYLADEKGILVTVIPSLGREISPIRDIATIVQLWRLIRRERPDVVHTHTAKAGFVGRVAAWLAGVPVIVHTYHGHVFAGYFGPTKTRVFLWLERLCARLSTKIITLSAGLKRELSEVYHVTSPDHIAVIELGFELDALAKVGRHVGSFRAQHNIPADAPLVGIVGRLVPIKNHELFLRVAQCIHQRTPDACFAIVGDGECRAELEALAQALGILDRVRFVGWQTDLVPIYSALDALVLCSNNEGLPVSLIEAIAAGVPVAATAVGGVSDLLDNGRLGAMVPPNNVEALTSAVIGALTDPQTKQLAIEARAAILNRYAIRVSVEHTEQLYRELLSTHTSR